LSDEPGDDIAAGVLCVRVRLSPVNKLLLSFRWWWERQGFPASANSRLGPTSCKECGRTEGAPERLDNN